MVMKYPRSRGSRTVIDVLVDWFRLPIRQRGRASTEISEALRSGVSIQCWLRLPVDSGWSRGYVDIAPAQNTGAPSSIVIILQDKVRIVAQGLYGPKEWPPGQRMPFERSAFSQWTALPRSVAETDAGRDSERSQDGRIRMRSISRPLGSIPRYSRQPRHEHSPTAERLRRTVLSVGIRGSGISERPSRSPTPCVWCHRWRERCLGRASVSPRRGVGAGHGTDCCTSNGGSCVVVTVRRLWPLGEQR